MGKYARYVSGQYKTEDQVEALVEKHEDIILKYHPNVSTKQKVQYAMHIEYITRKEWVRQQKLNKEADEQQKLIHALKANPTPGRLASVIAHKAKYGILDFIDQGGDFLGDSAMAVVTLSDVREVQAKRERKEVKKIVDNQLEHQQGMFATGRGPQVFNAKGGFGQPIIIVKKGVDQTPIGLTRATRNGKRINCFIVTDTGISVIKKRGSLEAWFDAHTDDYLVRVENGNISDFTGQNRDWARMDRDVESPWPPLAGLNTIGVGIETFVGLYLTEDQYEVIDPGMMIVKHFAKAAGEITVGAVEATVKAPSDIAELMRTAKDFIEPGMEVIEPILERLNKEAAKGDAAPVKVTFQPTIGTAIECEDAATSRFVVNGNPARGIRIGSLKDQVLALAGA